MLRGRNFFTDYARHTAVRQRLPRAHSRATVYAPHWCASVEGVLHDRIMRLLATDFLTVAQRRFTGGDFQLVCRVHEFTTRVYADSVPQRDSGLPAVSHPVAVALISTELVGRVDYTCLSLLHDLFEDCASLTREDVALIKALLDSEAVNDLHALSKRCASPLVEFPAADSRTYYHRLRRASQRAQIVKFCDRLHNLLDTQHVTRDKLNRQRRTTRDHLMLMTRDMLRAMDRTDPLRHAVEFFNQEFVRLCTGRLL